MKNRKRNIKIVLLAVLLILINIVVFMSGGSFSKYITQVEGSGVIRAAKWAFSVNGQTAALKTINLAQTCDASTLVDGKIAPGTSGSFDICIDATGAEVGIEYEVQVPSEGYIPENMKFSYNGNTSHTLSELVPYLKGTIDAQEENKTKVMTIEWEWPYEPDTTNLDTIKESDAKDTNDGEHLYQSRIDLVIVGKQVEPKG